MDVRIFSRLFAGFVLSSSAVASLWLPAYARPSGQIHRCDGSPALYTTDLRLIQARGCVPVDVERRVVRSAYQPPVHPEDGTPPEERSAKRTAYKPAAEVPRQVESRKATAAFMVSPQNQKVRDDGRKEVLMQELRDEQEKIDQLRGKINAARPELTGSARDELASALDRALSNVVALQRELSALRL